MKDVCINLEMSGIRDLIDEAERRVHVKRLRTDETHNTHAHIQISKSEYADFSLI